MKEIIINIGEKKTGDKQQVFIIAEFSANHLQKFENAVKLIKEAKQAGADAVKLQTYTPDTMTIDCDNEYFKIDQGTIWDGETLYELYKKAYTPWEWQHKLKKTAEELGLIFFSTPFDKTSVDFLEEMNVPAYKVASFEITDTPLIEYIASKKKPVIMSTGVAALDEIKVAVNTCRKIGNDQLILLKCTSAYPALYEEMNLKVIPDIKKRFNVITGVSDHTLGSSVPIAAVALGACVIEKHFTLDRKLGGPDSAFSLEPDEFKAMVRSVRETEKALGKVTYDLSERVRKSRAFMRSIFAVRDIKKGEIFTEENIRIIRPGYGLAPKYYKKILGKISSNDINRGTPLNRKHITKN